MHLNINPQAPLPIYAQIVEQIKNLVLGGAIGEGESLPSVRQLADSLEVNSLTIQKAYKLLESDGIIDIQKGVGAKVSEGLKTLRKPEREQLVATDVHGLVKKAKSLDLLKAGLVKMIESEWENQK